MSETRKKPLSTEEREYINRHLHGNLKKQQKREQKYTEIIDRRNQCLDALAPLAKLPGTDGVRKQLNERIASVKVLQITPDDFKKALKEFETIEKEVRLVVARQFKTGLSQQMLAKQGESLNKTLPIPSGRAEGFEKEVDKGFRHGGAGPKFKKVTGAMKLVEADPSEKNLAALEKAARDYLNGYDDNEQGNDEKTKRKAQICRDALLEVAEQRKYAQRLAALKPPPWDGKEETGARALQAEILLGRNPAKKLGAGQSGASESFFIPGKDGENAFIFKPGDGENVSGYGWQPGGGAPREVMTSAVNESLKECGLDCGVGRTSLMKLDHPSLATDKSGNKTQRVGAAQDFVKANGKTLDEYVEYDEEGKRSYKLPTNEVQKVLLLDLVTLQLDRNDGNLLFQDGEDGQAKVVPIDAGNALPTREAFESKRRAFTAGALFQTPQAEQPFTKEMLSTIEAMDPEKIAGAMGQANATMAEVDPTAATMVPPETIEMVKRSVQFLKKAAGKLQSPKQLGEAYQYCLQKVFDAPVGKVDEAIDAAIKETLERAELFKQLNQLKYMDVLRDNGWPIQKAEFSAEDPAYLLSIVKNPRPNPAALDEIARLTQALGGPVEAKRLIPDLESRRIDQQLRELQTTLLRESSKPEAQLAREGGDQLLAEAGVDTKDMAPKDKAAAMWKAIYDKLGGDRQIAALRAMGFANIQSVRQGGEPAGWVLEMRAWNEYERLGGGKRHVEIGGSGPPGPDCTPSKLLDNLVTLEAVARVRRDEVKQALRQSQQFIQQEDLKVQTLLGDALKLFEEAQDLGAQLPDALQRRDIDLLAQLGLDIKVRRQRIEQMIQQGAQEAQRIETELFKILPDEASAAKTGEKVGRKQIIENGLYRLVADLTSSSKGFPNYAKWLEAYDEVGKASLRGVANPLVAYRAMAPNDSKKLFRQEWPPIGGAEARISELLKGVKKQLEQAQSKGATTEGLALIRLDLDQLDQELPRMGRELDAFDRKLKTAAARYPQEVKAMASQVKPAKEDEFLVKAMKDLGELDKLVVEARKSLAGFTQTLQQQRQAHTLLAPQPRPPQEQTAPTNTGTPPTQDTVTTEDNSPKPKSTDTTQDDKEPLVQDLVEPAEPQILDESAPNPTLYFHPNTAKGNNYVVNSGPPGGQWQKVEQFCAYLAIHWLATSPGKGGIKFADLGDKQAAIRTLVQWGGSGGLAAQVGHAKSTLGGQDVAKATVLEDAVQGRHEAGTRIWFGDDTHSEGAFVTPQLKYVVYDPNTGGTVEKTGTDFASYARKAGAFVVA